MILGKSNYMDIAMNSLVASVINSWREDGLVLRSGASEEELDAFGNRHQVQLPDDFRGFYSSIDGIDNYNMDRHYLTFYPLGGIESAAQLLPPLAGVPRFGNFYPSDGDRWFVFADYLVCSHMYAIDLSPNERKRGRILLIYEPESVLLVNSFTEFLELYLNDPDKILFP